MPHRTAAALQTCAMRRKKEWREQIRSCSTAEKDKLSVMTAKRENVSDDKKEHEWGEVWREKAGTSCTEATACPNV